MVSHSDWDASVCSIFVPDIAGTGVVSTDGTAGVVVMSRTLESYPVTGVMGVTPWICNGLLSISLRLYESTKFVVGLFLFVAALIQVCSFPYRR